MTTQFLPLSYPSLTTTEGKHRVGRFVRPHPDFFWLCDTLPMNLLDRRSFLRGSALFAAAIGIAVVPAFAQAPQPKDKEKNKDKDKDKTPKDPFEKEEKKELKKLFDKEGREYRVCPQCAYNMYKQKNMWVCENCGYSYVE